MAMQQTDPYGAADEESVRRALLAKMKVAPSTAAPAAPDTTAATGIPQPETYPAVKQAPVAPYNGPEDVPAPGSFNPYEQGGFTGGEAPGPVTAPVTAPAPAAAPQTGQYASSLQGFDSAKLADPTHTTDKYTFARLAQNFAPTPDGLVALSQDPAFAKAGFKLVGKDKIQLANGEIIDVGLAFSQGGNKGWAWQPTTGPGGAALPATGGATAASANNPFTAGAAMGGGASGGAQADPSMQGRINQLLMQLMGQDPTKATESPIYNQAVSAYDLQQQRATERERNAIAERMDATGTSGSGAYDQALLGAEQQRGENTSAFAADLAMQEMTAQRDQIMQALQLSAGLMTDQQKLALSERLANLDAAIRRESMAQQNTQFNDSLGWDMSQWQYLANLLPFTAGT